jgi:hypothetical protein
LYKKKTISFTLMLIRGIRVSLKTIIQVKGNKPLFVTCRFKYVKFAIIKSVIAIQFFKLKETLTQFNIV